MIEIKNFKKMPEGVCKAKFSIVFPKMGMTINDCGLFEKDGKKWIALPSKAYEKDGQKKYFSLVFFEADKKKKLDDLVYMELSKLMNYEQNMENEIDDSFIPF
jgi:hypothetical protein